MLDLDQKDGPKKNGRVRLFQGGRHHCFAGVRAFMSRTSSAHFMIVPKDPESCGGTLANGATVQSENSLLG